MKSPCQPRGAQTISKALPVIVPLLDGSCAAAQTNERPCHCQPLVGCCSRNTWLAGDWKEASRTEDKAGERFDESSLGKIPYPARSQMRS